MTYHITIKLTLADVKDSETFDIMAAQMREHMVRAAEAVRRNYPQRSVIVHSDITKEYDR